MSVALVTGGSRGIGRVIAQTLAEKGFDIAVCYAGNEAAAKESVAACEAVGVKAICVKADVSKQEDVDNMFAAVKDRLGAVDVLVNNAGITRDNLMARMTEADYDLVIAVNQKSVFNMMKIVTEYMRKQRHGHIINLASVVGVYGNPGQVNYAASKAAIIGMTKTVAKELGSRNVTCNAVAPGFIHTPMTDKLTEEQKQKMLSMIAMKRYGEPEEIASVVSFLASEDSSYVTGQVIEIAGGLSI